MLIRPLMSRTMTYLMPYIRYNYGIKIANLFYETRPFDARILIKDETKPASFKNLKGIVCFFENPDNLSNFERHPCFMEYSQDYDYPAIIFKFEDEHAFNCFILGQYSKMYPKFLDNHREYFFNEYLGVTVVALVYEVCKKLDNRRYAVASALKVSPEDLRELDSKPDLNEELLLNPKNYSKWSDNSSNGSQKSQVSLGSLLTRMKQISEESMDLLP